MNIRFSTEIEQVIFFCKAHLDSGMANIVQSLQMARAMSLVSKVSVMAGSKSPEMAKKRIEFILGGKMTFTCHSSNKPLFMRIIHLASYLFNQRSRTQMVITRSPLIAILVLLLRQKPVLELHSDTLSTNTYLTRLIAKILSSKWGEGIFKVVISRALGNILHKKFGILVDLVLHDGWAKTNNVISKSKIIDKSRPHLVLYTGKLSSDRGIEQIFLLAEADPYSKFLIIGGTLSECRQLRVESKMRNLVNLRVYPYQRRKRISFLQHRADMLLAFWSHSVSTMEYCSPLKLFEYMSTGNKILLHNFNVFKEVTIQSPLINLCNPQDPISEHEKYFELKARKISNTDVDELKTHISQYSYDNRAKILWTKIHEYSVK